MYLQHGLNEGKQCGWFCRNLNKIAGIATALGMPVIGAQLLILNQAIRYISGGDFNWKTGGSGPIEYDLTQSEQNILDAWNNTYFTPFYESLLIALKNAKTMNKSVEKAFLIESITNQICIAKSLGITPTNGLSQNGILARNQLIKLTLDEIEKDLIPLSSGLTVAYITIPQNKIAINIGIQPSSTLIPCSSITFKTIASDGTSATASIKDKVTLGNLTSTLAPSFVQGAESNTNVAPEAVITKSSIWDTLKYPVYILGGYFLAKKAGIIK
jgi:hypothetical protein